MSKVIIASTITNNIEKLLTDDWRLQQQKKSYTSRKFLANENEWHDDDEDEKK